MIIAEAFNGPNESKANAADSVAEAMELHRNGSRDANGANMDTDGVVSIS